MENIEKYYFADLAKRFEKIKIFRKLKFQL